MEQRSNTIDYPLRAGHRAGAASRNQTQVILRKKNTISASVLETE